MQDQIQRRGHPFGRLRRLCVCVLCVTVVGGCATGSGPDAAGPIAKPTVYVAIDQSPNGFADAARDVTSRRLEDRAVVFSQQAKSETDLSLELQLTYVNQSETEFETIWGMTTALTATLYPSTCGHRYYVLTARLSDTQGHARSYEETDTSAAWRWLFQGSRCGETPSAQEIAAETTKMLDAVYARMLADNAFDGLAAASGVQSPLVRVDVNRAQAITESVLRVDRPFNRWSLGDTADTIPDYRIDLHFDVKQGDASMPKVALTFATLGLVSPCGATTISLEATVTGPNALVARTYAFTRSLRGHISNGGGAGCVEQDETNHPKAFADMVRNVLRQAAKDELITRRVATPSAPLVRVHAVRGEGVVRRETLRAAAFERYYFSDAPEYAPDFSLLLDLEMQGGGRKQLSTAGEAMAGLLIGLASIQTLCAPKQMTLVAVLQDRAGHEIRHYRITHTFAFSGDPTSSPTCIEDEFTNPAAVGQLVRMLYAQMRADGTLAMLAARTN
jgi:hypothetical protein